ncbi:hypothetical protein [Paenibacillus sp. 1-18]|uniref:hypothetical protein n=1 Tax=Paenibacillus sp. 1-18 TaxID=1333846 RepID=UPI00046FA1CE|nr:hypothetical protein [Paenibacillus sp. 1-18]
MERFGPGANDHTEHVESVVERAKAGDQQAYAINIRTFEKQIYTYCYYIRIITAWIKSGKKAAGISLYRPTRSNSCILMITTIKFDDEREVDELLLKPHFHCHQALYADRRQKIETRKPH